MDLRSIYIANGIGVFILLMLHYTARTKVLRRRAEDKRLVDEHNSRAPLYRIELSYGLSFFRNVSIDAFMKDMDDKMYEMKARHHGRQASPEQESEA